MYSTPGNSQSNFSIGLVARSSTSLELDPGMATITSTMGTLICGSSSRGSSTMAAPPNRTAAMMMSGVSLESMKDAAMRPAIPKACGFGEDSLMAWKSQVGHR